MHIEKSFVGFIFCIFLLVSIAGCSTVNTYTSANKKVVYRTKASEDSTKYGFKLPIVRVGLGVAGTGSSIAGGTGLFVNESQWKKYKVGDDQTGRRKLGKIPILGNHPLGPILLTAVGVSAIIAAVKMPTLIKMNPKELPQPSDIKSNFSYDSLKDTCGGLYGEYEVVYDKSNRCRRYFVNIQSSK